MPNYVYEACDKTHACPACQKGFDVMQSIHDPKLTQCPHCGAPIFRVIQAPALGRSESDLHYRAKRAGFKSLKRVQKGEYEPMY